MNIVIFTGAGISAESGIPTFRTNNGLWENHNIEDVCTLNGFNRNPTLVWNFYRDRYLNYSKALPNNAHYAITELQKYCKTKNINCSIVTQNVDGLHQKAGNEDVIELHGSITKFKCNECGEKTDKNLWESNKVLSCISQKCSGLMRPDIVWFGEMLPPSIDTALELSKKADKILVIGTSAQVYPAAEIATLGNQYNNAIVYEFNLKPYLSLFNEYYEFWKGSASKTVPKFVDEFMKV